MTRTTIKISVESKARILAWQQGYRDSIDAMLNRILDAAQDKEPEPKGKGK